MTNAPSNGPVAPPPPVWNGQSSAATTQQYAGFWLRVVASIIDTIILIIIGSIVGIFLPAPAPPSADDVVGNLDLVATQGVGKLAVLTLVAWAYYAFQESSSAQASLGKRLLGIRVSSVDGTKLSLGMASLRAWPLYAANIGFLIFPWLGWLIVLAALASCIAVAFNPRKQGLHDGMAKALLTKVR